MSTSAAALSVAAPESGQFYLEDLSLGQIFTSETYALDEAQIIAFASQFDPQVFHTDPEAAKATFFGGLAASGWHTAAITMRLLVGQQPLFVGGLVGAGTQITWPNATRPGDQLQVKSEVLDLLPSKSRPDRGRVRLRSLTVNQHGEVKQDMISTLVVQRRPVG
ncbi:MAG: MaoC family dehydratase [Zoogloea sp.]|uniref:MaoC family dehydratase n=1 Tax=Zoogloea sp. TaxID=49181 RepID=UPI003F2BC219